MPTLIANVSECCWPRWDLQYPNTYGLLLESPPNIFWIDGKAFNIHEAIVVYNQFADIMKNGVGINVFRGKGYKKNKGPYNRNGGAIARPVSKKENITDKPANVKTEKKGNGGAIAKVKKPENEAAIARPVNENGNGTVTDKPANVETEKKGNGGAIAKVKKTENEAAIARPVNENGNGTVTDKPANVRNENGNMASVDEEEKDKGEETAAVAASTTTNQTEGKEEEEDTQLNNNKFKCTLQLEVTHINEFIEIMDKLHKDLIDKIAKASDESKQQQRQQSQLDKDENEEAKDEKTDQYTSQHLEQKLSSSLLDPDCKYQPVIEKTSNAFQEAIDNLANALTTPPQMCFSAFPQTKI